MRRISGGVTRTVYLTDAHAVKVPCLRWGRRAPWFPFGALVRGWLANRSEWKQRARPDVARPMFTLGFVVQVYPRASEIGSWEPQDCPVAAVVSSGIEVDEDEGDDAWDPHAPCGHSIEEAKGSSWGRFDDEWRLIDFDRAWQHPRGWVGGVYYGRQERMARRWARL